MKLLHLADAHLDLPGRLADSARCWSAAVDIAIERDLDGVILAGDTFHSRNPSAAALARFVEGLRRLERERIPTVIVPGNHCWSADPVVQLFHRPPHVIVSIEPEVVDLAGLKVATLPWVSRHQLMAARPGLYRDDANVEMGELLVQILGSLRAEAPDVLVGHWTTQGGMTGSERDLSLLVGEPVLPLAELDGLGFLAFGHLHGAQPIRHLGWYAGSIDRVSFGEEDERKVVLEVDLEQPAKDVQAMGWSVTQHLTPARRFRTLSLKETLEAAETGEADIEGAIVRIKDQVDEQTYGPLPVSFLVRRLEALGAAQVKVDLEIQRPERARASELTESLGPLEALEEGFRVFDIPETDHPLLRDLAKHFLEEVG